MAAGTHARARAWQRLAAVLVVVGVSVGATVSGTAFGSSAAGTTITIAGTDYLHFDFLSEARPQNFQNLVPGYDRLLARGPKDSLVPYLAQSYKCTSKSCTFVLRKGAKCTDGTPVTPQVVLNSFKAQIERPKTADFRADAWGVGPYGASADVKSNTFTFRVGTPYSSLDQGFAWIGASIVCPAGLNNPDPNFLKDNFAGSGPYRLVSAVRGDQAVYQKRPEWNWGPKGTTAKDLPDQLVIKAIPNQTTAANVLLTGGVDIAPIVGPDVERLLTDQSIRHKDRTNYFPAVFMMSQFENRPTLDENLRKALVTAIDDKNWIQAAWDGHGIVSTSIIIPGVACHNDALDKQYGPKGGIPAAQKILADGGFKVVNGRLNFPNGQQVPTLTLVTSATNAGRGGEYLADAFKQLGLDIQLRNLDATTYGSVIVAGNFDLGVAQGTRDFPSANSFVGLIAGPATRDGGRNRSNAAANDKQVWREARLATQTVGAESCKHYTNLLKATYQHAYTRALGAQVLYAFYRPGVDFLWSSPLETYALRKK
jgi:peptide/nickel transport system substrate-binding protein